MPGEEKRIEAELQRKNKSVIKRQQLFEGDGLLITPHSNSFLFECCHCGLVHKVKIEHNDDGVVLRFFEDRSDSINHRPKIRIIDHDPQL